MREIKFDESRKTSKNYFLWRLNRAEKVIKRIEKVKNLSGQVVLDVGCGYGALSFALIQKGAKVTATELDNKCIKIAKTNLGRRKNFKIIEVKNEKLPFSQNCFDIIFLLDVLEHVHNPEKLILECKRVLKPAGLLYVDFTPFYSIVGHHLYDLTVLPIHFLPKQSVKKFIYKIAKNKGLISKKGLWDQYKRLNKIKINSFRQLVKDFRKIEERYIIKHPEVLEISLPFIGLLGSFKDYFVTNFEAIYQKI